VAVEVEVTDVLGIVTGWRRVRELGWVMMVKHPDWIMGDE